ncbi:MAG: hypothetical protein FJX89_01035 [Bacteroidetes bacterium]|nr:hypothetical protein [Bacteroidota bacterium]
MSTSKKIKSDPKTTLLVITLGMVAVYVITRMNWALLTALGIGVAGLLSQGLAEKIDWLWMKLTYVLSLIVPNILLSVVFYVFLTPIALLSRLFGNSNPLDLKNTSPSLFKDHKGKMDAASFEKPW